MTLSFITYYVLFSWLACGILFSYLYNILHDERYKLLPLLHGLIIIQYAVKTFYGVIHHFLTILKIFRIL